MQQNLPLLGTADTRLDPQAALGLAEQVLAEPRGLATTFNTSKITAEPTGRVPTGFSYRSYVKTPMIRMRMNDGYVVAQDNGQGGTRVSFHENNRYVMLWGGISAGLFLFIIILYFLLQPSEPRTFGEAYQQARRGSSGSNIGLLIGAIIGMIVAGITFADAWMAPKKVVALFNQRQTYGADGHAGFPVQPQPVFPGHPQPAMPQQPHGGFPPPQGVAQGQPHGGFAQPQPAGAFPPPQPQGGGGLPPPPPQGGFPSPPQGGFPRPPEGGFPPPPPLPGAFPPPQGGFPPAQPPQPGSFSAEDKLRELAQLRDSGIISPADYEQARVSLEAKRS